jgi:Carboxypeptidase regulatory-like domain/TonB dependent receptor
MKQTIFTSALILCLLALVPCSFAQPAAAPALQGVVTDPSGALVPGALVQLRGPGGEQRSTTDVSGRYSFASLRPGKYLVRVIAKGFTLVQNPNVEIASPLTLDFQLTIETEAQVVNVEEEANKVSADPASNGGAIVIREKELAALSDDPDELSQQLQAMAGPGAGPNGGQIYIDGFSGGSLPSKASIREVRINSNPFSPEYDRPGFGRIEIFTKPGTDKIHGQAFMQYNKEALNSRSPLLTQSERPPYKQQFFGFNLAGPLVKQKASFGFDAQRRSTTENAFVLATDLDSNLNRQSVNAAILTPQTFTTLSPRLDLALSTRHTLTVRYQNTRSSYDNQGVGSFNLASRAYNTRNSENTIQATETAVLSPRFINETRFQFMHTNSGMSGGTNDVAISVQGAFTNGGAQVGTSGTISNGWELTNTSTYTHGTHSVKWGGRLRGISDESTSMSNFGGTYTFLGGTGPELDANNQPIAGTSVQLDALEVYRRTLLFLKSGYTDAQIRALGGGAYQFSIGAGTPTTSVNRFDIGLFVNDDWRIRPNLTLSYGTRYETQTNIGDYGDWSPRFAIAWGIGGKANRAAKTILRAGAGIFYDRISESLTLQALRYNGTTQQSYVIFQPSFFPTVPSISSLAASRQPQQLQFLDSALRAPRNYQASIGIDRQINQYARLSFNYIASRGVHLQRSRDINAPVNGVYPYGDSELRMLTETTGFSRTNQFTVTPSINYKKLFLFGFYALSYGHTDAEGQAADPYNLRAEWGPSSFADVRHRLILGTSVPLVLKFSVSPFLSVQSGTPYSITTGLDTNGDGITAERPALVSGLGSAACIGQNLVYEAGFGCFNLKPAAGVATIGRNFARGPGSVMLMLRLSRTWAFGGKRDVDPNANGGPGGPGGGGPPPGGGGPGGGGGMRGGGGPPPGGGGPGGGPGGPPPGMGFNSGRRYTVTLGVNAMNVLNHANYAAPSGDLSSPYFGISRSLGGGFGPMSGSGTYNRKIDVQLRFGF